MSTTLGPGGMFPYLSGFQVASSANMAAQNYAGNLKIDYEQASGWPGAGTNYYGARR